MDTASLAALAASVQQSQTQQTLGLSLLRGNLHQQQDAVTTLLSGAGGGMVTDNRGQNLNITA
jgi:hypothetical protein